MDLLQAHRAVPYVLCTSWHGLFAIRIRSAPSVRKSAFGIKSCTKPYPKGHPPLYGSAFQALPTRGATTPLAFTFSLTSTRAALTRAAHSNRRLSDVVSLADFRTGEAPGSEKPEPASPKGDRRSVLSEKEIQDSDNCSCLHMGCLITLIDKQLYSSTGLQGALCAPCIK